MGASNQMNCYVAVVLDFASRDGMDQAVEIGMAENRPFSSS